MATKKKVAGRPKVTDKVKVRYIYLKDSQVKKVQGTHRTLTHAVLAKCG